MRWALIGPEGMLAVKLTREPNHPTWRCVREPSLDWVPPQGVEEIAVIGLDMLASRTGSVIQFWDYRQPPQGGEMRWMSVEPRAPGSDYRFAPPELVLDKLLAGPTPEARSPLPLRRLDAASMQALIDRVVPARFAWADGMDRRFLKVAKASGSGTADEQLFGVLDADGKEVIPPLYAHLEHHASHRRFQVTLGRGKAARSGFLDEKGRVVVPLVYEQLTRISNMGSEPTVVVQQGGKMGYLNMVSGQMQVELVYDALMAGGRLTDGYGEGLLIAVKDGQRGIVDTQGKVLTAFEFERLSEIPGGLIGHRVHDKLLFRIDEEQIVDTIPYVAPVPSLRPGDSLVGLGLRLKPAEESPSMLIEGVIPGGPAAKAGLQAGDLITAVDGHNVAKMSLQEVVTAIRGAVGTKVKLQIKRGAKTWALTVKRAAIVVQ